MEHITLQEYKQLQQKGNSKYKNKKVVIDGIEFDSEKEGNYYLELKILQKQGIIKDLRNQVRFELQPSYKKNGKTIRAINYVADFTYCRGRQIGCNRYKRLSYRGLQVKEKAI